MEIYFNLNRQVTNRQTYDVLEYFGDLGGFMEAIKFIGSIIVIPFVTIA